MSLPTPEGGRATEGTTVGSTAARLVSVIDENTENIWYKNQCDDIVVILLAGITVQCGFAYARPRFTGGRSH